MNKNELIEAVSFATDLTKADAGRAVNAVIETITATMKNGGKVALVGFGTFSVKLRPARTGRNPANGQPINIESALIPGFKPGKSLKETVNSN